MQTSVLPTGNQVVQNQQNISNQPYARPTQLSSAGVVSESHLLNPEDELDDDELLGKITYICIHLYIFRFLNLIYF